MTWTDSSPLDINYMAGATGWGSDGHWEHGCDYDYDAGVCDLPVYTCDCYNYLMLNEDNASNFTFHTRATNDIHVGLFTDENTDESSDMYEIVIGGWANS
jgi:hypothetical protein